MGRRERKPHGVSCFLLSTQELKRDPHRGSSNPLQGPTLSPAGSGSQSLFTRQFHSEATVRAGQGQVKWGPHFHGTNVFPDNRLPDAGWVPSAGMAISSTWEHHLSLDHRSRSYAHGTTALEEAPKCGEECSDLGLRSVCSGLNPAILPIHQPLLRASERNPTHTTHGKNRNKNLSMFPKNVRKKPSPSVTACCHLLALFSDPLSPSDSKVVTVRPGLCSSSPRGKEHPLFQGFHQKLLSGMSQAWFQSHVHPWTNQCTRVMSMLRQVRPGAHTPSPGVGGGSSLSQTMWTESWRRVHLPRKIRVLCPKRRNWLLERPKQQ